MTYDPKVHSKNKLGMGTMIPMAPMVPTAAQMNGIGVIHLRLMGESYLTTTIRNCVAPVRIKEVLSAVKSQPDEISYSGSDSLYKVLDIVPPVEGSNLVELRAGKVLVCKVLIDPAMDIVSSDESVAEQIDTDPTADPDEDPDDPSEND